MAVIKKTTTTKKPAAPRKPKATPKEDGVAEEVKAPVAKHEPVAKSEVEQAGEITLGDRYSYAVGRRKTSVANIRLFSGKNKSQINKKDILVYFGGNQGLVDLANKPLQLTGLENRVYVYVNVRGGGIHSQAEAIGQGISQALCKHNADFRKVLKKNGMLTRDSRMKERKKPGLKRARRGPQWAKR